MDSEVKQIFVAGTHLLRPDARLHIHLSNLLFSSDTHWSQTEWSDFDAMQEFSNRDLIDSLSHDQALYILLKI
jgi:hypothetical protein